MGRKRASASWGKVRVRSSKGWKRQAAIVLATTSLPVPEGPVMRVANSPMRVDSVRP